MFYEYIKCEAVYYTWPDNPVLLLCLRFPQPESASDDCEEDIRVDREPG